VRIRDAAFALRVVRRREGDAGIVYRRQLTPEGERLIRVGSISPLAFSAGAPLLRAAVRAADGSGARLAVGPWRPLNDDWGSRVACFAAVSEGLRNPERLTKAATHLKTSDSTEAAWWLGLMSEHSSGRAVRALRILVEAVE
jgi:hypothetical protein